MTNRGREYAESLVGPLDRGAYGQQRTVAQNTYNTNWENVQNQYRNLQDRLKLQQQKANKEFAEGLVDVAENSFNRQRIGSGNLANRGLSASGLTNILTQADTAQKGEDIGKLLKSAGDISAGTADKLSQANAKYTQESTNLMGKLADTLADIGDAETAAQNRYNQILAGIAEASEKREDNNALQAAQRGSSKSSLQTKLDNFYKRAAINEILASPDMTDDQKENYLRIMFGIDNAGQVVMAYNNNANAINDYNTRLAELQEAADKEIQKNRAILDPSYKVKPSILSKILDEFGPRIQTSLPYSLRPSVNQYITESNKSSIPKYENQIALSNLKNKGITYEDLAQILYGNK